MCGSRPVLGLNKQTIDCVNDYFANNVSMPADMLIDNASGGAFNLHQYVNTFDVVQDDATLATRAYSNAFFAFSGSYGMAPLDYKNGYILNASNGETLELGSLYVDDTNSNTINNRSFSSQDRQGRKRDFHYALNVNTVNQYLFAQHQNRDGYAPIDFVAEDPLVAVSAVTSHSVRSSAVDKSLTQIAQSAGVDVVSGDNITFTVDTLRAPKVKFVGFKPAESGGIGIGPFTLFGGGGTDAESAQIILEVDDLNLAIRNNTRGSAEDIVMDFKVAIEVGLRVSTGRLAIAPAGDFTDINVKSSLLSTTAQSRVELSDALNDAFDYIAESGLLETIVVTPIEQELDVVDGLPNIVDIACSVLNIDCATFASSIPGWDGLKSNATLFNGSIPFKYDVLLRHFNVDKSGAWLNIGGDVKPGYVGSCDESASTASVETYYSLCLK